MSRASWIRRAADRRAAAAVIFALTITPILGFVALAFDVGSAVWARSQLDLAADAAALTAVTAGAKDFAANPGTSFTPAQQAGVKRFNAQANNMPGVSLASLGVAVSRNGGTVTAVVGYTARYTTRFAGLFGFPSLPASGTVSTSRTPFFDIEIMMDDSSSMAIAAPQKFISAQAETPSKRQSTVARTAPTGSAAFADMVIAPL